MPAKGGFKEKAGILVIFAPYMKFDFQRLNKFAFVAFVLAFAAGAMQIANIKSGRSGGEYGENPGFYEEWYNQKKAADGSYPHWMRAKWAAWDKSQIRSRASENLIDTVLELGPKTTGGRTRSIWVDPRNDQFLLAAAISGGVWRSENGGASWSPLNDQETSLMASCFVSNPFNPDIVYYGTGEGRANSADVDGNGIYKSTDGGRTFSVIPSTVGLAGFETIWDIKHSLTDSNTIFVGTNSKGLFRTTDGGNTWEQVLFGGSNMLTSILVLPDNRIMATMNGNPMYYSDSGGKKGTFKNVAITGWPGSGTYRRIQLANCQKYPNVVYALVEGFGFNDPPKAFYKSSNGGRTWKAQTAPTAIGAGYQAYCVMIGVNPNDSNQVVTGGVNIAQTNNGGSTWTAKTVGHSDHHAFASFNTNTIYFLVGTDGGIYKYKYSSGALNATLNNGYQVTQFYAGNFGPDGYASISGAQDNGTHVATGVLTSQKFYGADGAYAHIGLQDGSVAYFSTQNAGIRRIRNFDPTIIPSFTDDISDSRFTNDGVSFINAYAVNSADQEQLYYRTDKYIYRSRDGGDNWTQITNLHASVKAIGISGQANPVVYVGGAAAQLYRINNAIDATPGSEISHNAAFPAIITSDFINSIVVHPNDKNTIFIGFNNFSNQGRVWRVSGLDSAKPQFLNISGNLPTGLPVNFVAVDPMFPDKNIFAGTDFGLYYSADSGKTWVKEMRIPNVAVHEIKMRADRVLFVYTHGRGMWCIPLSNSVSTKSTPKEPEVKIYPNPASDRIQISITGTINHASVSIFDASGKLVYTSRVMDNNIHIPVNEYKNGLYFVKIINNQESKISKVLVRK
ncbi:MAG: T9SS type A sorting domain-containing protein [Bacteroidetes bacterium]|nr:T9SS type A sorting domain-containing protein [Bacteroidota bacterium]